MDREAKDRPVRGRGEQEIRRTQSGHPVSGQGRRRPGTGSSDLKKNNIRREGTSRASYQEDGIRRSTSRDDGIR